MRDLKNLERILKALGNRRRLAIVRFLKQHPRSAVGTIAKAIALPFRTTSKHLAILAARDIVEFERRGLQILYRLHPQLPRVVKCILDLL